MGLPARSCMAASGSARRRLDRGNSIDHFFVAHGATRPALFFCAWKKGVSFFFYRHAIWFVLIEKMAPLCVWRVSGWTLTGQHSMAMLGQGGIPVRLRIYKEKKKTSHRRCLWVFIFFW
nr:hypothetical protein [Pandoravirus massiliensis]